MSLAFFVLFLPSNHVNYILYFRALPVLTVSIDFIVYYTCCTCPIISVRCSAVFRCYFLLLPSSSIKFPAILMRFQIMHFFTLFFANSIIDVALLLFSQYCFDRTVSCSCVAPYSQHYHERFPGGELGETVQV